MLLLSAAGVRGVRANVQQDVVTMLDADGAFVASPATVDASGLVGVEDGGRLYVLSKGRLLVRDATRDTLDLVRSIDIDVDAVDGTTAAPSAHGLLILGDYAYAAMGSAGLQIVHIPSESVVTAGAAQSAAALAVAREASSGRLVTAAGDAGLIAWSVTASTTLEAVDVYLTDSSALDVSIAENGLLLATGASGWLATFRLAAADGRLSLASQVNLASGGDIVQGLVLESNAALVANDCLAGLIAIRLDTTSGAIGGDLARVWVDDEAVRFITPLLNSVVVVRETAVHAFASSAMSYVAPSPSPTQTPEYTNGGVCLVASWWGVSVMVVGFVVGLI